MLLSFLGPGLPPGEARLLARSSVLGSPCMIAVSARSAFRIWNDHAGTLSRTPSFSVSLLDRSYPSGRLLAHGRGL